MKPNRSFRSAAPMWAALVIPVLWLAALLATGYEDGMTIFDLMGRFSSLLERPFAIRWTAHTLKFMAIALCCYGTSGLIGLIEEWFQNGMDLSKEELLDTAELLVDGATSKLLKEA